jgi:hypothetical protein
MNHAVRGSTLAWQSDRKADEVDSTFDGATVFSATMHRERDQLGERITAWLSLHPELAPVDTVVALSSDDRFHCLTIVMFWRWCT